MLSDCHVLMLWQVGQLMRLVSRLLWDALVWKPVADGRSILAFEMVYLNHFLCLNLIKEILVHCSVNIKWKQKLKDKCKTLNSNSLLRVHMLSSTLFWNTWNFIQTFVSFYSWDNIILAYAACWEIMVKENHFNAS